MKHYAGLNVSVKETSICIADEDGRISLASQMAWYDQLVRLRRDVFDRALVGRSPRPRCQARCAITG